MSDSRPRGVGIAAVLQQARAEVAAPSASLRSPKRPFTPAEAGRALFFSDDYRAGQRPSTAVSSGDLMATPRLGLSLRSSSFGLGEGPERGGRPPRADSFSATASLEVGGKEEASALTWGWADGEGEGEGGAPDRPSCPEHYGAISDACDKVNPVTEALVPLKEGDEEGAGAIAATLGEVESGVIALAAAMATAGVGPETRADSLVDALSMLPPWIAKAAKASVAAGVDCRRRFLRALVRFIDACPRDDLVLLASTLALQLSVPAVAVVKRKDEGAVATLGSTVARIPLHVIRQVFRCSKVPALDGTFARTRSVATLLSSFGESPSEALAALTAPAAGPISPLNLALTALHPDVLILAAGALKNVSYSDDNAAELVRLGAVEILSGVLQSGMAVVAEGSKSSKRGASEGGEEEEAGGDDPGSASSGGEGSSLFFTRRHVGQLAVQAVGCLRNLCGVVEEVDRFWSGVAGGDGSEPLGVLLSLGTSLLRHKEFCYNLSRIASKLSLYEPAQALLSSHSRHLRLLVAMVTAHPNHGPMLIRVLYTLGNLTSSNDSVRLSLAGRCDILTHLAGVVQRYSAVLAHRLDTEAGKLSSSTAVLLGGSSVSVAVGALKDVVTRDVEEVVVKALRVLANLAICMQVGETLCEHKVVATLVTLLEVFDISTSEELVLNVVSVVTNTSYYCTGGPEDTVMRCHDRLVPLMARLLTHSNPEAVVEAARAMSNLSRSPQARDAMLTLGVHASLLSLLSHPVPEVVLTACGVLLNLAGASPGKTAIGSAGGVPAVIAALGAAWFDRGDAALACVACKTLCNLVGEDGRGLLTPDDCVTLLQISGDIHDVMTEGGVAPPNKPDLMDVVVHLRGTVQAVVNSGAFREVDTGLEPL